MTPNTILDYIQSWFQKVQPLPRGKTDYYEKQEQFTIEQTIRTIHQVQT